MFDRGGYYNQPIQPHFYGSNSFVVFQKGTGKILEKCPSMELYKRTSERQSMECSVICTHDRLLYSVFYMLQREIQKGKTKYKYCKIPIISPGLIIICSKVFLQVVSRPVCKF